MKKVFKKQASALLSAAHFHLLKQGAEQLALTLSAQQLEQLFKYAQLIQKWNQVYNLTAIREAQDIITHHILDSLAILPKMDHESKQVDFRVLDVGAGAGLPGIILAIANPNWQVTLVDTVQKKAAFIQQAIAHLGLNNAQAIHARVEELKVPAFDMICSRAFSSIELFICLSEHLLKPTGRFAALKGKVEVDNSVPNGWKIETIHSIDVPYLEEERHLFIIQSHH
jgi:16S rRNA (guanine527-N7)-methyltransferase